MANKLSTIFVLFLILIIAFITYWLKTEVEKELLIKKNNNVSGPEFYLRNFNSIQTKKNGAIKFKISAKSMEQYDYAEYAILDKPYFTKYRNKKPYSYIKSNSGKVISGGDKYLFTDNVVLTRLKTKKKREMKLFTDQLDILPNLDIILTKKPVKIIQEPSIEIYGVGMKYDNKEGIVKLLSNVRVHYDNPSK
jgi:lipopolysaccharide export system protein LptC|tara:strand:+ start:530 stop:1108 length:579 start_codon:yes stop_codon:yes gene_type:complete